MSKRELGVIVAEGDSWFDYPLIGKRDILDVLEDYGYQVESVADMGDTVESMA